MFGLFSRLLSFGTTAESQQAYRDLTRGKYLTALHRLRREYVTWEQTPLAANFLLLALNAVDPWNTAWQLSGTGGQRPADAHDLVDPGPAIVAAASRHRVVVLMESHRAPETRYFGARLLPSLKAAGATHLAFETAMQSTLDQFVRTGVGRPNTEVYAFDPSRMRLLRTARSLSLKLVAFDFPPEGYLRDAIARLLGRKPSDAEATNRERERNMAENIVRLILKRDPTARVVVWTGEQHAMKRTPTNWPWQHPFMAAHLAQLSGEEPFCVWQECVDWLALGAGPRLLIGNHQWLSERGVDAVVLHHRGPSPDQPAWLDEGATLVDLASDDAELVQALPAAEGPRAVPVDQRLTHGRPVKLQLTPGRYLVRGLRGSDEVVWQRTLVV